MINGIIINRLKKIAYKVELTLVIEKIINNSNTPLTKFN